MLQELNKPPPESLSQKWANLPSGTRIGIIAGGSGAGALAIIAFFWFCLHQRKKGRLEHALEDAKFNAERAEMLNYQNSWKQSEFRHGGYTKVK